MDVHMTRFDALFLKNKMIPPINFPKWLKEHADKLAPPVNNFCLWNTKDFTVMAVGGPNQRTDYHINPTEVWQN
jgi:3-hydroxyanthranilate 3,4-dioxygenase